MSITDCVYGHNTELPKNSTTKSFYYSYSNLNIFNDFKYWQQNICKVLKCITNTPFTYLCNLAGTDYELPEDDAVASKHVAAVS